MSNDKELTLEDALLSIKDLERRIAGLERRNGKLGPQKPTQECLDQQDESLASINKILEIAEILNVDPKTVHALDIRPAASPHLTTDPTDPRLGHGGDTVPGPQNKVYLVLSEEERAKGFIRPVRRSYKHVGVQPPKYPLRDLTEEEHTRYDQYGYIKYEAYPNSDGTSTEGMFWTQKTLNNKGCGTVTTMGLTLCQTYARDPTFYGSTYCVGCSMHLPVAEFIWCEDGKVVGS
jgi:hypothetical protein